MLWENVVTNSIVVGAFAFDQMNSYYCLGILTDSNGMYKCNNEYVVILETEIMYNVRGINFILFAINSKKLT